MPNFVPAASSTRNAFGHDFLADAVARDDGNAMRRGHGVSCGERRNERSARGWKMTC